jgi:hypothetical protein
MAAAAITPRLSETFLIPANLPAVSFTRDPRQIRNLDEQLRSRLPSDLGQKT